MLTPLKETQALCQATCPVCRGRQAHALYDYEYSAKKFLILRCCDCGHVFVDPLPLASLDERMMPQTAKPQAREAYRRKSYEILFARRQVGRVKKILGEEGGKRLLDVGCGSGWYSAIWKKHGFDVSGLEPLAENAVMARDVYGITVIPGHLEDLSTEAVFDVIVLRHCLEHLASPLEALGKIRKLLRPGGVLVVIVPNILSIGCMIFREDWSWGLPHHFHFFAPATLHGLLARSGFLKKAFYQIPSLVYYPCSLSGWAQRRFGIRLGLAIAGVLCVPLMAVGYLFGHGDNLCAFYQKKDQ